MIKLDLALYYHSSTYLFHQNKSSNRVLLSPMFSRGQSILSPPKKNSLPWQKLSIDQHIPVSFSTDIKDSRCSNMPWFNTERASPDFPTLNNRHVLRELREVAMNLVVRA